MDSQSIRESYLNFFKSKGHFIQQSDSLVPSNDKSLLFTSAGMNQFKDMFLGSKRLPYSRITSCQKCLRTGDLEVVGTTNRHHSFFEMLGNFSFGDYFKREAIQFAWEYLTKELKIPENRLFVSIYTKDEESFDIWNKEMRIPPPKIFRFDEIDNFWPSNAPANGPDGPCGPCSEIYYDFGHQYSCGKSSCTVGCGCGRYTEIWNLVFTGFERKGLNNLIQLKQPNIDTGMGLERLAAVMQGKFSNFETDLFYPIIEAAKSHILSISGNYPELSSLRKIADHIRAAIFCISDGIMPSNEERGYVVRRIIRQAQRHVHKYEVNEPLLYKLIPVVRDIMKKQYPIISEKEEGITLIIKSEEEKFLKVIDNGNAQLQELIKSAKMNSRTQLSAEEVFFLYDTYGFPPELTREISLENQIDVDLQGFTLKSADQKQVSRQKSGFSSEIFDKGALFEIKSTIKPTKFVGYERSTENATILAMLKNNNLINTACQGDAVSIVLDTTPFYAEGGGQVGDSGTMITTNCKIQIEDTKSIDGRYLHHGKVLSGTINTGAKITAQIDENRRLSIMRNHTATHLLQAALRKALGTHVEQTGSVVEEHRLRFDFTHPKPLTREEILLVEEYINNEILNCVNIEKMEMPIEQAKKMGAIMFFGEKYPEIVRVVKTGDHFSIELCGGTHLGNTSMVGIFKIVSESSIGSGVRRIEAITGAKAKELFVSQYTTLLELQQMFKTGLNDLIDKIDKLVNENNKLKSQVKKSASGGDAIDEIIKSAKTAGNHKFCVYVFDSEMNADSLRNITDSLLKTDLSITLLVSMLNEKQLGILGVSKSLIKNSLDSKSIISKLGLKGGGKPHMAQVGFAQTITKEQLEKNIGDILSSVP